MSIRPPEPEPEPEPRPARDRDRDRDRACEYSSLAFARRARATRVSYPFSSRASIDEGSIFVRERGIGRLLVCLSRDSIITCVFFLRMAPRVFFRASWNVSSSSTSASASASNWAWSASSSSSSASSLAMMSGSIKSATLWPSKISGTASYRHSSFSRMCSRRRSTDHLPGPPPSRSISLSVLYAGRSSDSMAARRRATASGICGRRSTSSRATGSATWSRERIESMFDVVILSSTRIARRRSHAFSLTSVIPSSVRVDMAIISTPSVTSD
eukprot:Amastigsp_a341476_41.p2 type:complete len:271 gc:universal Amastigsp_a341476_41:285-1097(+)